MTSLHTQIGASSQPGKKQKGWQCKHTMLLAFYRKQPDPIPWRKNKINGYLINKGCFVTRKLPITNFTYPSGVLPMTVSLQFRSPSVSNATLNHTVLKLSFLYCNHNWMRLELTCCPSFTCLNPSINGTLAQCRGSKAVMLVVTVIATVRYLLYYNLWTILRYGKTTEFSFKFPQYWRQIWGFRSSVTGLVRITHTLAHWNSITFQRRPESSTTPLQEP
jgi:hypothetical protein